MIYITGVCLEEEITRLGSSKREMGGAGGGTTVS